MFTAKKKPRGGVGSYLQVIESYRPTGGSPRHRVIAYVGNYSTLDEALVHLPKDVSFAKRKATKARNEAERLRKEIENIQATPNSYLPPRNLRRLEELEHEARAKRKKGEELDARYQMLERLVEEHPELLKK